MEYVSQLRNTLEAIEAQIQRAIAENDRERQTCLEDQAARLEADLIAWEIDLAGW
jgi:predicted ribosome quality control (RQC) complex YloA/Tae2 family protein